MAHSSKIGISFSMRRRKILIYRGTIRALQMPEYIRFMVNLPSKKFVIQACEETDPNAINISKAMDTDWEMYEFTNKEFLALIYRSAEWDLDCVYRADGIYHPLNRLVEFDLKRAVVICGEDLLESADVHGIN